MTAFALDRFQTEAMAAIDADRNVLVAAPTGAGKTVIAEHAVARALARGRRAFYTTPIKALSNQKHADLVAAHGPEAVGLLTGDNAVNPDAPIVVMTTEVLRNMIYAGSRSLDDLEWVVLDEVHYLQDHYRGPVWEEVIINAPSQIRFVCLSATVSNAEELSAWIGAARGRTETVIETERPVELVDHFLVKDRRTDDLLQVETLIDGRPNPDGDRFDEPNRPLPRHLRNRGSARRRWETPSRPDVVEHLRDARLLPAIHFIFSRAGCDGAARSVLASGIRLTDRSERDEIRSIVESHTSDIGASDLEVLDYDRFLAGMESGVAAHHAGMVPPFKEAVEACFVRGLVKVVFATETLALGINMPARSVVIEALSKFTGEHHEDLTPSQYTQLTGRAGRRGLDPVGHALVLWSPWHGFDKVAALASSNEYVLRSSFRPTPNMVANLIAGHDREKAHELLGRSFAQFQADRGLGRLAHRRARMRRRLAEATAEATCERGSIDDLVARREAERHRAKLAAEAEADAIEDAMGEMQPGDVFEFGRHRYGVLSVAHRRGSVRINAVDPDAHVSNFDPSDFDSPPRAVGRVELPEPFDPRNRVIQRRLSSEVRRADLDHGRGAAEPPQADGRSRLGSRATAEPEAGPSPASATQAVEDCPDLQRHLDAVAERERLHKRLADIERQLEERSSSLGRSFDRLVELLERHGFVRGWELTDRGKVLARTFHENDLLCAEVTCDGTLDGLEPAELAGLVSVLTYEHRSKEPPPPPWYPSPDLKKRVARIEATAARLDRDQRGLGLDGTRPPDPTFLPLAQAWAAGAPLNAVIGDDEMTGGDFVRAIRSLSDLLGQVATTAPDRGTRRSARAAAEALSHGIVSAHAPSPLGVGTVVDPSAVQASPATRSGNPGVGRGRRR